MFNFEKLEIWEEAINFADIVYTVIQTFPEAERLIKCGGRRFDFVESGRR